MNKNVLFLMNCFFYKIKFFIIKDLELKKSKKKLVNVINEFIQFF